MIQSTRGLLKSGKRIGTQLQHSTLRNVPPSTFLRNPILSRSTCTTCTTYMAMQHILNDISQGKYLWIIITGNNDLSWLDRIISSNSAKATRSVGFLRRNMKTCPQNIRNHLTQQWYDQHWINQVSVVMGPLPASIDSPT